MGDSTEYESGQVLFRFGKDFAVTANTVKRESFRFMEITFHGNICANTGGTNVQSRTVLAI